MDKKDILLNIKSNKIIAIVRGFKTWQCLELAKALYEGGINMIEVTFDQADDSLTKCTIESIQAIKETFNGKVIPGAGTVITVDQVDMAQKAGAEYIISPNMDVDVIKYTKKKGLISIPGAMTATEVVTAHRAGADFVKLFPITNLGADYIKALKGPLNYIDFLAVGGVSPDNILDFMNAGAVGAGVGGLLTRRELVEAGEFDKIRMLAKKYVEKINGYNE